MTTSWKCTECGLVNFASATNCKRCGAAAVSAAWLIVVARVVTVKNIDDRLVWLKGINSNYLSQLPPWQSQV